MPVIAMTHWRAAFTGGHEVILPAGEVFTVYALHEPMFQFRPDL
jgi:hypothetical protein